MKILYIILLLVELTLDFMALSILWNSSFHIGVIIISLIWGALLLTLIPKFKKADDAVAKRKVYIKLVLTMILPVIIFVILVIAFAIKLSTVI